MGNGFPGVAGDPNNNCPYCKVGMDWGWTGKGVFHTHDESLPEIFQEKETIVVSHNTKLPEMVKPNHFPHKHDESLHKTFKANITAVDPLTFLGDDIGVTNGELEDTKQTIVYFFKDSEIDPVKEVHIDIVTALAKLKRYRIRKPLKISEETKMMIGYAKVGDFDKALGIMNKYPGIVNYIPANRAWGLLHQAAYFDNCEAIETILKNPKCDPFLKTKTALGGAVPPGSTADVIAKDEVAKQLITDHQKVKIADIESRSKNTVVTLQSENEIKVDTILMVLNCFESVLYPETLQSKDSLIYSNLMLDIFTFINSRRNWKRARREVSLQLQSLDISLACFLATEKEDGDIISDVDETKDRFFSRIIRLYTTTMSVNSNYNSKFYTALNFSLLTHGCKTSFVTGEDLALAAYGTLLNSILMYWGNLTPTNEPTYRGMYLTEEQIDKYQVGEAITWLCFTSSSIECSTAKNFGTVLFNFDNSHLTKYAAKGIEEESHFPGEKEFLYPSGARFRVTNIEKKGEKTSVWIRLEDY